MTERSGLIAREVFGAECEKCPQEYVMRSRLCLLAEEGEDESANKGAADGGLGEMKRCGKVGQTIRGMVGWIDG